MSILMDKCDLSDSYFKLCKIISSSFLKNYMFFCKFMNSNYKYQHLYNIFLLDATVRDYRLNKGRRAAEPQRIWSVTTP